MLHDFWSVYDNFGRHFIEHHYIESIQLKSFFALLFLVLELNVKTYYKQ